MKILAIALTVLSVLVFVAAVAAFVLGTWTGDERWGMTGFVLFFPVFTGLGIGTGLVWTGVDL